jgi:hypothetical protein
MRFKLMLLACLSCPSGHALSKLFHSQAGAERSVHQVEMGIPARDHQTGANRHLTSFISVSGFQFVVGQRVIGPTGQRTPQELPLPLLAEELAERLADGRGFLLQAGDFLDLL